MDSNRRTAQKADEILELVRGSSQFGGFAVCRLAEVSSTQDVGWELLRRGEKCALVIADRQLCGRGRCGRTWHSSGSGNVYLSAAVSNLRQNCDLASFAFRFAGKVSKMFMDDFAVALDVKAPNDLMLNGKKIGGILVETACAMAVIGIGINLVHDEALQSQCSQPVGSIDSVKSLAADDVAVRICGLLAEDLRQISSSEYFSPTGSQSSLTSLSASAQAKGRDN
jgi:BirA family biotin operon repressor/biotin-[acetyl-CoA-carboxylase] ligase